ncbi:MAG: tRNA lysidine(34) synthetase TilS [Pseudomonadota bacterium]
MKFGADFDALIERFSARSETPIALAVSGGGDSLALLHLTADWAARNQRSLLILTVDHGLRAGARAEADLVKQIAVKRGLEHRILTWAHPRKSQNAARKARYQLLGQACQAAGAGCLLTGHTLDDVVETAFIRRRRKVRGGAEIGPVLAAPLPAWPAGRGIAVVRPLLQATRADLRNLLNARACVWAEDPSNLHTEYERVRVRQFLSRHPTFARIASKYVQAAQIRRVELDRELAAQLKLVQVASDGLIYVPDHTCSAKLLRLLASCASGSDQAPRADVVRRMIAHLDTPGRRQTLGGAWFQRVQSGYKIGRDPGTKVLTEAEGLFDGRFAVAASRAEPVAAGAGFLVRHATPPAGAWTEIISDRIAHMTHCFDTPWYCPIEAN